TVTIECRQTGCRRIGCRRTGCRRIGCRRTGNTPNYVYSKYKFNNDYSGAVLANRLTKVNGWSVLLIEAGDYETILTDVPVLAANHQLSKIDWNFTTEPQDTDVVLI
ncbi:glucose dehydrogenase [FAD, quinone]-like, partial [Myzus persicae]|uniref:glucose dehydrogenase [FAD, quinone]-like n=1 Tax=Myzus persicae TaxID=13164 RepID=UPI000B936FA3